MVSFSKIIANATKLKSNEHDNESTAVEWTPKSPDLNPVKPFWYEVVQEVGIMDEQQTNLQQLYFAVMSTWT